MSADILMAFAFQPLNLSHKLEAHLVIQSESFFQLVHSLIDECDRLHACGLRMDLAPVGFSSYSRAPRR
jgi:hypothetical protein